MTKKRFWEFLLILLGSLLYAISTHLFIFPAGLLLGGTSGISVILNSFWKISSGNILMIINALLLLTAFVVLGRGMAVKTFVGSTVTTLAIGLLDNLFPMAAPLIGNVYVSSVAGAAVIAVASGVLFYVDSSSGGTDIVALIVKKYSSLQIGKALLATDVLIVVVGGILSGWQIAIASFMGLLVKTLGIDVVVAWIKRIKIRSLP